MGEPCLLIAVGHSPALHLLGVSTVAGNQTVEKVPHPLAALLPAMCKRGAGQVEPKFCSRLCLASSPDLHSLPHHESR